MTAELEQAFTDATGVAFGESWAAYSQDGTSVLYISQSLRFKLIDQGLDAVSLGFVSGMFQICGNMAEALRYAPNDCMVVQLIGWDPDIWNVAPPELCQELVKLRFTLLHLDRQWAAFSSDDYPLQCGYIQLGTPG